jgi:hypothetical protein
MPTQEKLEKSKLQRTNPVKLQRFWCMDVPFFAYQLSTGEIVMSKTQFLPNITKTLIQIVLDYISENNLPTQQGTIPNNHIVELYPLPTVVEVLKYLHERALLTGQKDLLAALLSGTAILEDSDLLLMTNADLRTRVEPTPSTPPLAKVLKFPIGKLSLSVCIGKNEEIYVSDSEGLSVINVPLSWLIELNPGQKKALILKRNGFSFKEETLFYQDIDEARASIFKTKGRSWSDWLVVWEYFASKGNSKALSLLRNLAGQSIEQRLRTLANLEPQSLH